LAKGNISTGNASSLKSWWENGKQYLSGVYNELKKVHWPGKNQLIGYTGVVLLSVALMALIVWLFDKGLSFVLEKLMQAVA
jgi:preprotein translocase subunit SecE